MQTRQEKAIFDSDDYHLKCSLCGKDTKHDDIEYACISPHIHSDDKGSPEKHTYELNNFCDCCCRCFYQEENGYTIDKETGYICIICKDCGAKSGRNFRT